MIRALAFSTLLLLGVSCTTDPPARSRPVEAEAPPVAPDLPSPPLPRSADEASPEGPDPTKLQKLLEGMARAAEEAAEAEGATTCDQAFDSTVRFARALRENLGAPAPRGGEPSRERFLAACARLPEPVQQCMVMQYSMAHREECARLREGMSPETRARVHELTTMLGLQERLEPPAE